MAMSNDFLLHNGEPNDILSEHGLRSVGVPEAIIPRSLAKNSSVFTDLLEVQFPNLDWTAVDFSPVYKQFMKQEFTDEDSDLISVENANIGTSVTPYEDIPTTVGNGSNKTAEVLGTDVVDLVNTTLFGNTSTPTNETQGNQSWIWWVVIAFSIIILFGFTLIMARRRYCKKIRLDVARAREGVESAANTDNPHAAADAAPVTPPSFKLVPLKESDNAENVVSSNPAGPSQES